MEASCQGVALAVEFEIDFCLSPAGKLYAPQIVLIVCAGKSQGTGDAAIVEMDCSADARNFALQTDLAGTLRVGRPTADSQRHRRLLQVVENGGEKRIQKLFVDGYGCFRCRGIHNAAATRD